MVLEVMFSLNLISTDCAKVSKKANFSYSLDKTNNMRQIFGGYWYDHGFDGKVLRNSFRNKSLVKNDLRSIHIADYYRHTKII